MNIWNKVLIGLICPLALLATFWSLKVRSHYKTSWTEARKIESDTANALQAIEKAMDYDTGIPTLQVRNAALLADRAENWRGCLPLSVEPLQTKRARITFSVNQEPTSTMAVGDLIYVFDQRPFGQGGQYLGRFTVSRVQGVDITAESLDVLNDLELQNLVSSQQEIARNAPAQTTQGDEQEQGAVPEQAAEIQAAWSVFSRCPADRYDLFKDLSDEEKEKYLPNATLRDLLKI